MFLPRAVARRSFPEFIRTFSAQSSPITWEQIGKPQKTIATAVERSGKGLHSGVSATVRLLPALAGEGRSFARAGDSESIPATIDHVVESQLCTTLSKGSARVSTVEHLMSALEGCGLNNIRVEIEGGSEVPILDGSSLEWVEAIEEAGVCSAKDDTGNARPTFAPVVHEPLYIWRDDSFVAAFPHPKTRISYGIDFSQVPAIGCQWMSCFPFDQQVFTQDIAPARTFCIFEEVTSSMWLCLKFGDRLQGDVTATSWLLSDRQLEECWTYPRRSGGWMNLPLRFDDEPCRHKILDLIGDLSLLSENGNQGLPVAHLVAYKAGHALHARFASLFKSHMMSHREPAIQSSPNARTSWNHGAHYST